jgi:hypothetical protein
LAKLTISAVCAASVVGLFHVARMLGASVPSPVLRFVVGAATLTAAAVAARSVFLLWGGPAIVPFDRRDAVFCDVAESAAVRAAAQVRESKGGAGYVGRWRLALPTATWAAVAVQSAAFVSAGEGEPALWPLPIVALGTVLSVLFPAMPFCYREMSGGCVLVHPPLVGLRIVEAAGVPPALTAFDPKRSGTAASHVPVTLPPHVERDDAAVPKPAGAGAEPAEPAVELGVDDRCA